MIHPSAVIHSTASIGEQAEIGPDTLIEKNVCIGAGTTIGARVVIGEGTRIGKACRILEFAKIGVAPGDSTPNRRKIWFVMGDENTVQECVMLDRGTVGKTTVGNRNLFMANSHVGPDCVIGNNVVLAVGAALSGRNLIGDHAVLGGLAAVDASFRIGTHALVTASTRVSRDVPPYMLASGPRARVFGPNTAALRNHGFSEDRLSELKRAYYLIFRAGLSLKQALKKLTEEELVQTREIQQIIRFVQGAQKVKRRN